MSTRSLLVAVTLLAQATAFAGTTPQRGEPFTADGIRAFRAISTLPAGTAPRTATAYASTSVSDATGDFIPVTFFDEPSNPPTGTTASIEIPPWFIARHLSQAANVVAYFQVGSQFHAFAIPWTVQGFTYTPPAPAQTVPVSVSQISAQNTGTVIRVTMALSAAMPGAGASWGYGIYACDSACETVFAKAQAWNYPGFGFQRLWAYPSESAFAGYRQSWHDMISATVRQTAARTLEVELVTAGPLPAATASGLIDARFNFFFFDFEDQFTSTILQIEATGGGWAARLLTLTGFWGDPVVQLAPPVVSGNRVTATVPLDPVPVRNQFKFYLAVRLTLNTEVGKVFSTDVDEMPDSGLVAMTLTDPPEIVVSSFPGALLQTTTAPGATTAFTLTNAGDIETTVTLGQQGDFFTVSPAVFAIGAGKSQVVTVTGVSKPSGSYAGTIKPNGLGVPSGLAIPVVMLVSTPPSGEAKAQATDNRVDVTADAAQTSVPGQASFRNVGTSALTGLAIADVPWLTFSNPLVTIGAGETGTINFTIDRSKRNDAHAPLGSATGSLSLQYLSGSGSGAATALLYRLMNGVPVSRTLVTVTDTAKPKTTQGDPGPLGAGEVALFLSSVGHAVSPVGVFVSDVQVSALTPLGSLRMTYTPAGQPFSASRTFTLPALTSAQPLGFTDFTRTVFDQDSGLGTLQIRGESVNLLDVSASVFNKSNPAGTYGSAVPVLRSDRAIGAGERLFIPGVLGSSAGGRTNLMVQETSGNYASVTVTLLNASGATIASLPKTIEPFQHWRENTFAPAGAVAATVAVDAGSSGRVLAYATPVDALSGDTWVLTDWPRVLGFDASARQIVPIAGRILGGNNNFFRTSLAIMNRAAAPASVVVRFYPGGVSRTVIIPPASTSSWGDLLKDLLALDSGLGYLDIDPQGSPVVVTSRTFATVGDSAATFGTAVPAVPAAGMKLGDMERISGFDDADRETITARMPATFRTNFGLVETAGKSATVRLTLHFRHPQGTRLTIVGSASKDIFINPNEFYFRQFIAQEILGDFRQSLQGNLKDLFLEVEVIGGEGRIIGFTSSVDNGSSDQLFKLE
jgi:hypothetical protein